MSNLPHDHLFKLRHTVAHLLAAAVQELYPDAKRTIGPVIENGFYYDFDFERPLASDLKAIEKNAGYCQDMERVRAFRNVARGCQGVLQG